MVSYLSYGVRYANLSGEDRYFVTLVIEGVRFEPLSRWQLLYLRGLKSY
jgi:hypothetical protein